MTTINSVSLCLLFAISPPLYAMNPEGVTKALLCVNDLQEIEASDAPLELARSKVAAAQNCEAPYLQVAMLMKKLELFSVLLEAGAPCIRDACGEFPMDTALRMRSWPCIYALSAPDKYIRYAQHEAENLKNYDQNSLMYFTTRICQVTKDNPHKYVRIQRYVVERYSDDNIRECIHRGLLYVPSDEEFTRHYGDAYAKCYFLDKICTLYKDEPTLPLEPLIRAVYLLAINRTPIDPFKANSRIVDLIAFCIPNITAADLVHKYVSNHSEFCPLSPFHVNKEESAQFIKEKIYPYTTRGITANRRSLLCGLYEFFSARKNIHPKPE